MDGIYLPEAGTMDGGGKAGSASDGDKEDTTRARTSKHPDQHGQSGIYLLESGVMGGGGKVGSVSNGDKKGSTRA